MYDTAANSLIPALSRMEAAAFERGNPARGWYLRGISDGISMGDDEELYAYRRRGVPPEFRSEWLRGYSVGLSLILA